MVLHRLLLDMAFRKIRMSVFNDEYRKPGEDQVFTWSTSLKSLPRKASKDKYIGSVPQTDTGG